jgi:hypothetical protein
LKTTNVSAHAVSPRDTSGQLPFLGLSTLMMSAILPEALLMPFMVVTRVNRELCAVFGVLADMRNPAGGGSAVKSKR